MHPPQTKLIRSLLVRNASEICLPESHGQGIERLARHALYIENSRVHWLGPEYLLPNTFEPELIVDAGNHAVLPGLIDAHTHLIFGGQRTEDFARRTSGLTYTEIAAAGGGIHTTVTATRKASDTELQTRTVLFLQQRRQMGIATTEIKSGYGLDVHEEIRLLEMGQKLQQAGWDLELTLLAAHALPKEIPRTEYVALIIDELLPLVAKRNLARFVDVYVEQHAYTIEEARHIFLKARDLGIQAKIHAEQLSNCGGTQLAAEVQAISADHLEFIDEAGINALKDQHVVATLLPGAMTYLGQSFPKLGRRLMEAGVEVAVATDMNPGSSPSNNLPLMATLAATQMGLSTEQSLRAVTLGAAHALGRNDIGSLQPGMLGRFIILNDTDSRTLVAAFGEPIVDSIYGF